MDIRIYKYIVKVRQKYIVPARYSSHTFYKVYVDDKVVFDDAIAARFGSLKKLVEALKKKYEFTDYTLGNWGAQYRDA